MIVQLAFDLATKSDTALPLDAPLGNPEGVTICGKDEDATSDPPKSVMPACPLCKGHMTNSTCDRCGMEVCL